MNPIEELKDDHLTGFAYSRRVFVGSSELDPAESLKLRNHSPDGFAWGYGGSGPSQLALAVLLHLKGREFALAHYQQFKADVISGIPMNQSFSMPLDIVRAWISGITANA